jgi:Uma2 family endonuclease
MVSAAIPEAQPYTAWPPDDTEESVVGTDRHQMTITNVRLGINELAHAAVSPGQPLPWQALSQTVLLGCRRRDGTRYRTMPDVFVYKKPIDQDRGSVSLWKDGPPALIIEVASDSTYDNDLDLQTGKAWSYEQAGVHEYAIVDPTALFLPSPVLAWRLVEGHYQTWEPDVAGLWWSEEIPIGIGIADGAVTIYDREGRGQLREGEFLTSIANARAEVEELRRRLAELEGR